MANNYTLFSHELEKLSAAEVAALTERRAQLVALGDNPPDFVFEQGRGYLISEESGDVDGAVDLIQTLLRLRSRPEFHVLSYAVTCSKPRPNEFGGGAVLVFHDRVQWLDPEMTLRLRGAELLKIYLAAAKVRAENAAKAVAKRKRKNARRALSRKKAR